MNDAEAQPNMPKKCPQCGATLPEGALGALCPACLLAQGTADTSAPTGEPLFHPPSVEEVARMFPKLQILELLGKGGMGAVYKARQPELDRFVALKILPPRMAIPGFAERFNREARALARLSHPNIVGVYEFGEVNGQPFFVMEYVDGPNLRQLERAGKLSPREALQIVPQICEALQFAHDEGIVHRDIKPENILIDRKGRVKIADFGIAKIIGRAGETKEPELTETQGTIGTPHYMAPEQVEKPQAVDHRADIFALGVVFYEMLTGELPLGKFAPPSRRVQVDVRLDDVVLRTLEKEPERRYQQASHVKTAVETIASGAGGGAGAGAKAESTPPPIDADAFAREVLAHDYNISIRHCFRRGWELVKGDFWPLVAVTALMWLLWAIVNTTGSAAVEHPIFGSLLALLVEGALEGGLLYYFIRKIRRQPATVETAFAGFSSRFLPLFLCYLVMCILILLGLFLLIVPGIFLMVAWMFALPLIMDKRMEFWPAMELSRKVVCKHWFKIFGLLVAIFLFKLLGVLACGLGFFVASPIAIAAYMYAYEDIFGRYGTASGSPTGANFGPAGTRVVSGEPTHGAGGSRWQPATVIGIGVVLLFLVMIGGFVVVLNMQRHHRIARANAIHEPISVPMDNGNRNDPPRSSNFGPETVTTIRQRSASANQFLDLDTGKLFTVPADIAQSLATTEAGQDERRFWQALDIPQDSQRYRYIEWLRESGVDLMYTGDGRIVTFNGIFAMAHGKTADRWDDFEAIRARDVSDAITVVDWNRRASQAVRNGEPIPKGPKAGGIVNSAAQLDSQSAGGPKVNLLTREQSVLWYFQTQEGAKGLLELTEFQDDPAGAKVRFKLLNSSGGSGLGAVGAAERKSKAEDLEARLNAAKLITVTDARDSALTKLAIYSAEAGEAELARSTLQAISMVSTRDDTALAVVRALTRNHLRSAAVGIANEISGISVRDQALSELATTKSDTTD